MYCVARGEFQSVLNGFSERLNLPDSCSVIAFLMLVLWCFHALVLFCLNALVLWYCSASEVKPIGIQCRTN